MVTGSLKIPVDALLVWFLESICVNLFFGCTFTALCCRLLNTEQIRQIMTLEESVQHVVMTAIQEVSEPLAYPLVSRYFALIPALSHG